MLSLILAATVFETVCCTNCNGVGYVLYDCPKCSGSGVVSQQVRKKIVGGINIPNCFITVTEKVPCRYCFQGAYNPAGKAIGKKKTGCKVCHGQKKIKVKKP